MKLLRWLATAAAAGLIPLAAQTYTFSTSSFRVVTYGMVLDSSGNLYATDYYGATLKKLAPDGTVTTVAGRSSYTGSADGLDGDARFNYPRGIAIDASGNLYIADTNNHEIRKVTSAGVVTTVAGSTTSGTVDGVASVARFWAPQGIAIDANGNLFVADTGNHAIRKITPAGVVSTLAGLAGTPGAADGVGAAARFNSPQALALDASGNLYVADTNNCAIRKVTPTGGVTTVAGSLGNAGFVDDVGALARFTAPVGIAIDSAGNLWVTDATTQTVRWISPTGLVTTVAGQNAYWGMNDGVGVAARFATPSAITTGANGLVYVGDNIGLRVGTPSSQLAITVQPQSLPVASGSSAIFSVTATGATPITYQWIKDGTAIPGATGARYTVPAVQAADAGTYSVRVQNPVGTLLSANAVLTAMSPLPNDNFAQAQLLSGTSGTFSGSNNGATGEPGEPTHYYVSATATSVWYKWTPDVSGTTVLTTTAASASIVAGVYTGDALGSLHRVAQGNLSPLTFSAVAGTTYYIAIGSNNLTTRATFTVAWRMVLNDAFAHAQVLNGDSGEVTGTNSGATGEAGEPNHLPGSSASSTSVWYQWTPTQDGTLVIQSKNTTFGLVVAVYTGTSLSNLVKQTADPLPSTTAKSVVNVKAGTTYSIAVGSYAYPTGTFTLTWQLTQMPQLMAGFSPVMVVVGQPFFLAADFTSSSPLTFTWSKDGSPLLNANRGVYNVDHAQASDAGQYTVTATNSAGFATATGNVTVLVPPSNDLFANAQILSGITGSVTGSDVNATGESGEPMHWNSYGTASSVWYAWTPTATGLAEIDTVGSSFDTVLAVYTGQSLTTLSRLTQDDESGGSHASLVTFAAKSGTTYYIAVGSATSVRANLVLNWQLTPALAITAQPSAQTIMVGGSATFSVQATGTNITYQWNRNGVPIPGQTAPTLTVDNVQGGSDATYTVSVTNSTGSITSAPATLAIAAPSLTNFATRNTRTGGGWLWSIAGGGNALVAVGSGGEIFSSSDNGQTWIPRDSGTTVWLVGVTYGSGQFVVVGDAGTILTSADSTTWQPAKWVGTAERINNVLFADGKFVAVGEHGTILTSSDAQTWTPRTSGIVTWLHGLAYNARIGYFATCGANGVFLYSSDAVTWTALPITGFNQNLEAVASVDSYAEFVAVGAAGSCVSVYQTPVQLKTGESVTTWSAETNPTGINEDFRGLACGGGALFATGTSGRIISAKDSSSPWYTIPSGTSDILLGATFYNDTLFAIGGNDTVLQSDPLYNARLINISTRAQVGTDEKILISGFVVTGSQPKQVLVRAAGPALANAPFNLSGVLAHPALTVLDAHGKPIATNTGWTTNTDPTAIATAAAQVGAFPFGSGSADSALLLTLSPGQYTAQVVGADGHTGLALVEVYDADALSNSSSRAINISTRGLTGSGDNVMIAGFVVSGASSRRVLIRGIGPTLANFTLPGVADAPQLTLYNSHGLITATAKEWGLQSNADEIRTAAKTVGAFDLPEGSNDSAMVLTLLPGTWTVQVSNPSNPTALTLIEVYDLP